MKNLGQAALEFLTTYGWAILIILVMMGALAYFGVINPKKFLPEKCIFSSGLTCNDYRVSLDGISQQLEVTFTNNLGKSVVIQNIEIIPDLSVNEKECELPSPNVIKSGERGNFDCIFLGKYSKGSNIKIDVIITYKDLSGAYNHTIQGEIFTKVQE